MNLSVGNWETFLLGRIFDIKKGKRLTSADQEEGLNIYIGAIDSNNGVANYIGQAPIHKGNTISLSYNGSVGEAFYQPKPYWATDDVNALYSKYEKFNEYIGLFLVTVIRQEKYKFSYGRKWTLENMKITEIELPIARDSNGKPLIDNTHKYSDKGYIPDWNYMEDYIKSLHYKPITTKNTGKVGCGINEWYEFRFGNLISKIYKAKAINKDDLTECNDKKESIRYITRTSNDNGCEMRVLLEDINPKLIEKGNAITVGDTTATCFYQSEQFITGDHMVVIRAEWLTRERALFVVAMLSNEQFKYSYGRAYLMDRIKDTIIKLPIIKNDDGTPFIDEQKKYSDKGYVPDWKNVENYIRALHYGDRLEVLN